MSVYTPAPLAEKRHVLPSAKWESQVEFDGHVYKFQIVAFNPEQARRKLKATIRQTRHAKPSIDCGSDSAQLSEILSYTAGDESVLSTIVVGEKKVFKCIDDVVNVMEFSKLQNRDVSFARVC